MPPPSATPPRPIYEGLPLAAKLVIILLGLGGGAASVIFSAQQAAKLQERLGYSEPDAKLLQSICTQANGNGAAPIPFVVHALNVQTHLKAITNRQAIGVLSVGTGIAFLAIGFALFIVGADGAFKVHLQAPQDARVVLYGTAPGLLCFLLSAVIIAFAGYTSRYDLDLGKYTEAQPGPVRTEKKNLMKPLNIQTRSIFDGNQPEE